MYHAIYFSLVHLPVPSISIYFVANITRSVVLSRSSVHLRTNVSWTSVNSAKVSGQIQVSYDREEVFLNNGVNMTLERVPLAVYSYLPLIVGRTDQRWWGVGKSRLVCNTNGEIERMRSFEFFVWLFRVVVTKCLRSFSNISWISLNMAILPSDHFYQALSEFVQH